MKSFLRKNTGLVIWLLLAFITVVINQFPLLIEKYYSTGLYIYISRGERTLLGWLPFSFGDLLYGTAVIFLVVKLFRMMRRLVKKQFNRQVLLRYGRQVLQGCLMIYVSFNWLWGFNYNRLGSAYQMQLQFDRYTNAELLRLTDTLHNRMLPYMNDSAAFLPFNKTAALTKECMAGYSLAEKQFPFLAYRYSSVKPHILYTIGNYIGFMGYLNPFTAEAQLNTTVPLLLKPAVLCHEMGHQLGYASESEANFIAFITCRAAMPSAICTTGIRPELFRILKACHPK